MPVPAPLPSAASAVSYWLLALGCRPRTLTAGLGGCYLWIMTPQEIETLSYLRRARDLIDREYEKPLDVPTMARKASTRCRGGVAR